MTDKQCIKKGIINRKKCQLLKKRQPHKLDDFLTHDGFQHSFHAIWKVFSKELELKADLAECVS